MIKDLCFFFGGVVVLFAVLYLLHAVL